MRLAQELLMMFVVLIVVYLVLVKSTGFVTDITAIGKSATQLATTFQGRN